MENGSCKLCSFVWALIVTITFLPPAEVPCQNNRTAEVYLKKKVYITIYYTYLKHFTSKIKC